LLTEQSAPTGRSVRPALPKEHTHHRHDRHQPQEEENRSGNKPPTSTRSEGYGESKHPQHDEALRHVRADANQCRHRTLFLRARRDTGILARNGILESLLPVVRAHEGSLTGPALRDVGAITTTNRGSNASDWRTRPYRSHCRSCPSPLGTLNRYTSPRCTHRFYHRVGPRSPSLATRMTKRNTEHNRVAMAPNARSGGVVQANGHTISPKDPHSNHVKTSENRSETRSTTTAALPGPYLTSVQPFGRASLGGSVVGTSDFLIAARPATASPASPKRRVEIRRVGRPGGY